MRPGSVIARINLARVFALEDRRAGAEREVNLALGADTGNSITRHALLALRSGSLR